MQEVVTSSREGGASLNILSGLVAGNFSAFWLGLAIVGPDGDWRTGVSIAAVWISLMLAPAGVRLRSGRVWFLGMGPVTIAVDSYGPVTDNAQSVFELSTIEQIPASQRDQEATFGFDAELRTGEGLPGRKRRRGQHLQSDRQTGLIGTAVVGATTMIFSIIMALTERADDLSCSRIFRFCIRRSCWA